MSSKTEFEDAYRATAYRVFLPGGAVELRIGAAHPGLAAWLKEAGVRSWAILTAFNPGSARKEAGDNQERQAALECALLEAEYEPFVGENVADSADWPPEESCFVTNIPREEGMALAHQFGQNAFVFGEADGVPHLIWTKVDKDEQDNRPL